MGDLILKRLVLVILLISIFTTTGNQVSFQEDRLFSSEDFDGEYIKPNGLIFPKVNV